MKAIRKSSQVLLAYRGKQLTVEGLLECHVDYRDEGRTSGTYVVKGDNPALFGHDWMSEIEPD